jgi:hypothetical protein
MPVKDKFGVQHQAELKEISKNTACAFGPSLDLISHNVRDDFLMRENVWETEVAIYSDDRPIEFWRTIEGFVEATAQD